MMNEAETRTPLKDSKTTLYLYDRQCQHIANTKSNQPRQNQWNDIAEAEILETLSLKKELRSLSSLALPTVIVNLSFVVPPFLTASYIGRRFGHIYLDGYSLANLTGNLVILAVLQGFFNACDTLAPQAFAAKNYQEVGLVVLRGYVSTIVVILPLNAILVFFMDDLLVFFGQDPAVAQHAHEFYVIYALSFPFSSLYTVTWKFLSAQNIMMPLVICTLISTLLVLPICLEVFVRYIGFEGAALAITLFYIFESISVVSWISIWKPHHPETWPGLGAWREVISWKPFMAFWHLGVGGMLSSLEWVYWESLALIIGTMGVLPLSAHTVPSQVMFIMFMFPMGIGIALAVRLGAAMTHNVRLAKLLAAGTLLCSFMFFSMLSLLMYRYRYVLFSIFTKEDEVIDLCDKIWFDVCLYFVILSCFAVNMGISTGLGMQWTFGTLTVVSLWLLGLPASYLFAVVQDGGLKAAWRCIWPPYLLVNIAAVATFLTSDWNEISSSIRIREGAESNSASWSEYLPLVDEGRADRSSQNGSTSEIT